MKAFPGGPLLSNNDNNLACQKLKAVQSGKQLNGESVKQWE